MVGDKEKERDINKQVDIERERQRLNWQREKVIDGDVEIKKMVKMTNERER